jgi:hypothetical protein
VLSSRLALPKYAVLGGNDLIRLAYNDFGVATCGVHFENLGVIVPTNHRDKLGTITTEKHDSGRYRIIWLKHFVFPLSGFE